MAALNRFGKHVFNQMLPEYFRRYTNGQLYSFKYDWPQLGHHGVFNVNWALTKAPTIHNRVMDLDFFFDVFE